MLLFSGYWSQRLISNGAGSNGYDDRLIEEEEAEEGADSLEVAIKCAEIQNAISVGELPFSCLYLRFVFEFCMMKIKLFSLIFMSYLLFYIVQNMNPQ